MEIEKPSNNTQIIAKKVWSILRIMFFMVKKGISKSKLILDLNILFKRGNELASKAMNGLLMHHQSLICRPNNPNQHFISPKEYEFSCSNSPELGPFQFMMANHKRGKSKHHHHHHHHHHHQNYHLEDPTTVAAVQRVLQMLNSNEEPTASPYGRSGPGLGIYDLPGFGYGKSPSVRQLRITDSPFPLKNGKGNKEEEEEDVKVNKAADEFIKKFYKNLKMQKSSESPYHASSR